MTAQALTFKEQETRLATQISPLIEELTTAIYQGLTQCLPVEQAPKDNSLPAIEAAFVELQTTANTATTDDSLLRKMYQYLVDLIELRDGLKESRNVLKIERRAEEEEVEQIAGAETRKIEGFRVLDYIARRIQKLAKKINNDQGLMSLIRQRKGLGKRIATLAQGFTQIEGIENNTQSLLTIEESLAECLQQLEKKMRFFTIAQRALKDFHIDELLDSMELSNTISKEFSDRIQQSSSRATTETISISGQTASNSNSASFASFITHNLGRLTDRFNDTIAINAKDANKNTLSTNHVALVFDNETKLQALNEQFMELLSLSNASIRDIKGFLEFIVNFSGDDKLLQILHHVISTNDFKNISSSVYSPGNSSPSALATQYQPAGESIAKVINEYLALIHMKAQLESIKTHNDAIRAITTKIKEQFQSVEDEDLEVIASRKNAAINYIQEFCFAHPELEQPLMQFLENVFKNVNAQISQKNLELYNKSEKELRVLFAKLDKEEDSKAIQKIIEQLHAQLQITREQYQKSIPKLNSDIKQKFDALITKTEEKLLRKIIDKNITLRIKNSFKSLENIDFEAIEEIKYEAENYIKQFCMDHSKYERHLELFLEKINEQLSQKNLELYNKYKEELKVLFERFDKTEDPIALPAITEQLDEKLKITREKYQKAIPKLNSEIKQKFEALITKAEENLARKLALKNMTLKIKEWFKPLKNPDFADIEKAKHEAENDIGEFCMTYPEHKEYLEQFLEKEYKPFDAKVKQANEEQYNEYAEELAAIHNELIQTKDLEATWETIEQLESTIKECNVFVVEFHPAVKPEFEALISKYTDMLAASYKVQFMQGVASVLAELDAPAIKNKAWAKTLNHKIQEAAKNLASSNCTSEIAKHLITETRSACANAINEASQAGIFIPLQRKLISCCKQLGIPPKYWTPSLQKRAALDVITSKLAIPEQEQSNSRKLSR